MSLNVIILNFKLYFLRVKNKTFTGKYDIYK